MSYQIATLAYIMSIISAVILCFFTCAGVFKILDNAFDVGKKVIILTILGVFSTAFFYWLIWLLEPMTKVN